MPGVVPLIVVSIVAAALLVSTVVLAVKYNNQLLPDCPRCPPSSAKSFRSQSGSQRITVAENVCFSNQAHYTVRARPGAGIAGVFFTFADGVRRTGWAVTLRNGSYYADGEVEAEPGVHRVSFMQPIMPVEPDGQLALDIRVPNSRGRCCFDRLEIILS
jgi:hypothetical protein